MKPKYIKVDNELYPINTDFRYVLKCNEIALDNTIGDFERTEAYIYILFGEKGLNASYEVQNKLIELSQQFLQVNKETVFDEQPSYQLDWKKCEGLIRSSFKYDYGYDPYELKYLHWYDFYNDLANLSSSELGNCCILNRVTSILNTDLSQIKDDNQREKTHKAQIELTERYCINTSSKPTEKQEESLNEFYKAMGWA